MGVPKFFRWLSERYPKINQPFTSPPCPDTRAAHFPDSYRPPPSGDYPPRTAAERAAYDIEHDHHIKCNIRPDFDRLYIDMNGIIHCCSHNNANDDDPTIDPEIHLDAAERSARHPGQTKDPPGTVAITEEQIFQNVCYYLDRIISDVAQPRELVYLAIDGVAPRAKMNQQRSRRYRSGKEREIEATFYEAHLASAASSQQQQRGGSGPGEEIIFRGFDGDGHEDDLYEEERDSLSGVSASAAQDGKALAAMHGHENIREVTPGRFSGTFQTQGDHLQTDDDLLLPPHRGGLGDADSNDEHEHFAAEDTDESSAAKKTGNGTGTTFHSNTITPGTPFFDRCTAHIKEFIKKKLKEDPRWADLTIIFSGPDVPGEGEHKIMDFIRRERARADYDPNTRHCLFGQDGDLVMLGLATHEPNFCLLREEVIFEEGRKAAALAKHQLAGGESSGKLSASLDAYMHNANFELLHMSLLRDYLAYEFETNDAVPSSPFDIESTIDDFVFMTFFVGNDFLPHMPALDIGDEAFDLLFYTYKRHRYGWLASEMEKHDVKRGDAKPYPYLTRAGSIVSGSRLEEFLSEVGGHEDPYYDNKSRKKDKELAKIRKYDKKAGRGPSIPSDKALWNREEKDRERYMAMLQRISTNEEDHDRGSFSPVISSGELPQPSEDASKETVFRPEENELGVGFLNNMSQLLKNSLSPATAEVGGIGNGKKLGTAEITEKSDAPSSALQSSSLTDLKGRYYYDKFGFTPVDAEKHRALRKAYIEGLVWNLEYYYKGCTSWEWYYPYHYGPMLSDLVDIDTLLDDISFEGKQGEPLRPYEQLLGCLPPSSADLLPEPYQWLMKSRKSPIIDFYPESFTVDMNGKRWPWEAVVLLPWIDADRLIEASRTLATDDMLTEEERKRNEFGTGFVFRRDEETVFDEEKWSGTLSSDPVFAPEILEGTSIPLSGFPTLKDAPVQGLLRRRVGVNVFGMRSRYRTAILQMDNELPAFPPASVLGPKFIGTTLFFRYPHLQEGFVTAVSDAKSTIRGNSPLRRWTKSEVEEWEMRTAALNKKCMAGEGLTGSGGWLIPNSTVTLCVRPLKGIETMPDGTKVKVFAAAEAEIPLTTALWNPSRLDSRFSSLPVRLEKNPYKFARVDGDGKTKLLGKLKSRKNGGKGRTTSVPVLPGIPDVASKKPLRDEDLLPPLPRCADGGSSGMSILPPLDGKDTAPLIASSTKRGFASETFRRTQLRGPTGSAGKNRSITTLAAGRAVRAGGLRGRAAAALAVAAALLVPGASGSALLASKQPFIAQFSHPLSSSSTRNALIDLRGGSVTDTVDASGPSAPSTPPLEFAHGTTTLAFKFQGGIIAAVDSRASIGSFVGSKTTQKVLPVSKHILGTMAGGAADCSFWIRKLRAAARKHELTEGRSITVARASKILSSALYEYRGLQLSVGTMIMGYDDIGGASIYYVDSSGTRIGGDMFSVGSGSTFALAILDTERRYEMTEEEAIALGIKAIRHATFRDAYSGGYIGVYLITKEGWKKVFSEDLALSADNLLKKEDAASIQ